MQFCKDHWDHLKLLIDRKGMSHLIATSGEEAMLRMKRKQDGQVVTPDPLLEAHNMIMSRAIECLGIYIVTQRVSAETDEELVNPSSHYCPLCEAKKNLPPHPESGLACDESWLETLTDYLKKEYTKEGWLNNN